LVMPGTDSHENNAGGGHARFLWLGFTLIAIIGALTAAGFFLDRLLGTLPLFLIAGLVLGFVAGLYYVYKVLKRLDDG
jgi:ATP synthase protein I